MRFARLLSSRRLNAPFLLLPLLLCSLAACASNTESTVDAPLVEGKYKLSADREALQEIREQIPEDKRQENDEIAYSLQWMGEVKRPPGEVREKFNSGVSKKRALFQKDMQTRRETFVKKERKDREEFQRELETSRKAFSSKKPGSEERKRFYDEHDTKRKDFYSSQRERRDAFEADIRDRRKNFDDYIREKTAEFNQEHRAYSKRFDDMKKLNELKKKKAAEEARAKAKDIENEYREIDKKPSQPLGTEE
jgi:hypothetical protein